MCHGQGRQQKRFDAFRELIQKLLVLTVMDGGGRVGFDQSWVPDSRTKLLVGRSQDLDLNTIPLKNGCYLRITMTVRITTNNHLAVPVSSFQYQAHEGDQAEIFRYDYTREQKDRHPRAHLNVHGNLSQSVLPRGKHLQSVHFPTGRIPLEAVIRLLIEQFEVPAATSDDVWMAALAASEDEFRQVCDRPLSGPEDAADLSKAS